MAGHAAGGRVPGHRAGAAYDLLRMSGREGRPTPLGTAFAEYGRIAKTLHLLRVVDPVDDTYRRQMNLQLTVQESRHKLARDIRPGKRGQIMQAYRTGSPADRFGMDGRAVTAHHLDVRMPAQPLLQGRSLTIGQDIDAFPGTGVDEDRAVTVPARRSEVVRPHGLGDLPLRQGYVHQHAQGRVPRHPYGQHRQHPHRRPAGRLLDQRRQP